MSLVSEALRKARREAAVEEAVRQGRVVPAHLLEPSRRRRGLGRLIAVLALVAVAGMAGALTAWWLRGRTESPPSATASSPAEAPTPSVEPLAAPVRSGSLPSRAEPTPLPAPALEAAQERSETTPAMTQVPVDRARTEETPPKDGGAATVQGGRDRVFVIDADLGRVKLHLDFIVHKPSAPFAGINGAQVVPGSMVEGLLVEEIGQDFVRLRDTRGAVTLRVR